jgi:hypothetical protein
LPEDDESVIASAVEKKSTLCAVVGRTGADA